MAKKKYNVIREEMLQVASNVAQEKNIDQDSVFSAMEQALEKAARVKYGQEICLLYTSPSPRDGLLSRMPSSA